MTHLCWFISRPATRKRRHSELPEATVIAQQIGAELKGKQIEHGTRGNATHKFAFASGTAEGYEAILKGKMVGPARGHGGAILVPIEPRHVLVLGAAGGDPSVPVFTSA